MTHNRHNFSFLVTLHASTSLGTVTHDVTYACWYCTRANVYVCILVHVPTCTYVSVHMPTCVCVCGWVHINPTVIGMCTNVYVCVGTRAKVFMTMGVHVPMCTCVWVHTCHWVLECCQGRQDFSLLSQLLLRLQAEDTVEGACRQSSEPVCGLQEQCRCYPSSSRLETHPPCAVMVWGGERYVWNYAISVRIKNCACNVI